MFRMSAFTGRFQPGLVTALVKVAMIGSSRRRSFLDDDQSLDDVAGFVPDEPAPPVRLSVTPASVVAADQPVVASGHSVAA